MSEQIEVSRAHIEENLFNESTEGEQVDAETVDIKERSEEVMEKSRHGRAELFKKVFASRAMKMAESPLFLKLVNYAPVLGDVTLLAGAVRGKEGGRELTAGERLNYLLALGMSGMAYMSVYEGDLTAAGIEQSLVYAILHIDTVPVAVKTAAAAIEGKMPKLAAMMNASADFMLKKREQLADLKTLFERDPYITLGLSIDKA